MKYSKKLPLLFLFPDDPRHLLTLIVILIAVILIVRIFFRGKENGPGFEQ